jgi:hypothetical protein
MKIEECRSVLINLTILLTIITAFLFFYKKINPFFLPGIWEKLIIIGIIFWVISIILYSTEIVAFLGKTKDRMKGKKFKKEFQKNKLRIDYDFISEKLDLKKNKFIITFGLFLFLSYSVFLIWVFPKLNFHEFIFFIILLYIPISLSFKLSSNYPVIISIILLLITGISVLFFPMELSEKIFIYSYYFLIIGIILNIIDFLRENR